MKKILLITAIALVGGSMPAFAQPAKRTSAFNAWNDYKKSKDPAMLAKARTYIDEVCQHPDTKDETKSWVYRGGIYLAQFSADLLAEKGKIKDVTDAGKLNSMMYAAVPTANLSEAFNAFAKAFTMDAKKVYESDIIPGLNDCYSHTQNIGIANYNSKKYAEAIPMFEMAAEIKSIRGMTDSLNISNAGQSALNAGNYDKAIANFKKLTEIKFGKANSYVSLAKAYKGKGDNAGYKQAIADGLKVYPDNADLITEDVNMKIAEGRSQDAVDGLNLLISKRSDDPQVRLVVAQVYEHMANPKGADGKDAAKPANYDELVNKAGEHYEKAATMKADYFDAYYGAGILFYNQAVYYYNLAGSEIKDAAKYSGMYEAPAKKAIAMLEKAHLLNPKDMDTMTALKMCYGLIGDNDNYNRIKEEMQKAK